MSKLLLFLFSVFLIFLSFLFIKNNYSIENIDSLTTRTKEEKTLISKSPPKISSTFQLQEKIDREKILKAEEEKNTTILTEQNLIKLLMDKGVEIDADIAQRADKGEMTDKDLEWLQTLIAANLTDEENFKVDVSKYHNFNDVKNAYIARSNTTGLFYGNDILNTPGIYKDASANDIIEILKEGADLPEDAMLHMIINNNSNLALQLKEYGYNLNVNYHDKLSTMGLLEIQTKVFTWHPTGTPIEKQLESIDNLITLGVPIKEYDGTRDALDRALGAAAATEDPEAAKNLMILSKKLNEAGISLEKSHKEILETLKRKYPDLYTEYGTTFR